MIWWCEFHYISWFCLFVLFHLNYSFVLYRSHTSYFARNYVDLVLLASTLAWPFLCQRLTLTSTLSVWHYFPLPRGIGPSNHRVFAASSKHTPKARTKHSRCRLLSDLPASPIQLCPVPTSAPLRHLAEDAAVKLDGTGWRTAEGDSDSGTHIQPRLRLITLIFVTFLLADYCYALSTCTGITCYHFHFHTPPRSHLTSHIFWKWFWLQDNQIPDTPSPCEVS